MAKMYKVLMTVKDNETDELIEEHDFVWPESVYKMYKAQTSVAQGMFKKAMGMK